MLRDNEDPTLPFNQYASYIFFLACGIAGLAGRPPIWAETTPDAVAAIVSFAPDQATFPSAFPVAGRELVLRLLEPNPDNRATISSTAADPFFDGIDVFTLYKAKAPELVRGAVDPVPDAKWARRQQSMLWQPMPSDFTGAENNAKRPVPETATELNAPFIAQMQLIAEK